MDNAMNRRVVVIPFDVVFTDEKQDRSLPYKLQKEKARGIPVSFSQTLFVVAIAVVVTLSISSVGLLILNSLLVLPAASARNISRNLKQYHGFSVLFALTANISGLTVSYYLGCSAGAAISLILALIFGATFACRKGRA